MAGPFSPDEKVYFQYEPLPIEGDSGPYVRLVELPPGEKKGEISCSLRTYPLSQSPEYEAVSYCWGDFTNRVQIHCEGRLLSIPSNLYAFLLRTRAKGIKRTLWADAICINQADNSEKTKHVQLMRDVYRRAKRTLIWLGEEYDHSTEGLEFVRHLYNAANNGEAQKPTSSWNAWWPASRRPGSSVSSRSEWRAFFKLLNRPWFTRAWVVQEVVVSSQPIIVCGDKTVHWK
ncbi:MAG: hypothetical protein Q9164_007668, partial [Protoblastenia rupestris]